LEEVKFFANRNDAVEWAENTLLLRHGSEDLMPQEVAIEDFAALAPLSADDILLLVSSMVESRIADSQIIRRVGQDFGGVYFILNGKVVTSTHSGDSPIRHATLSAGMTFGEIALGGEGGQTTRVTALGEVHLKVLSAEAIAELEKGHPEVALRFWKAIARDAYTSVEEKLKESSHPLR
jgi:glutaminase